MDQHLIFRTDVVLAAATSSSQKLTNYKLECDLIFDFVREANDQAWMQNTTNTNQTTDWSIWRDAHLQTHMMLDSADGKQLDQDRPKYAVAAMSHFVCTPMEQLDVHQLVIYTNIRKMCVISIFL